MVMWMKAKRKRAVELSVNKYCSVAETLMKSRRRN